MTDVVPTMVLKGEVLDDLAADTEHMIMTLWSLIQQQPTGVTTPVLQTTFLQALFETAGDVYHIPRGERASYCRAALAKVVDKHTTASPIPSFILNRLSHLLTATTWTEFEAALLAPSSSCWSCLCGCCIRGTKVSATAGIKPNVKLLRSLRKLPSPPPLMVMQPYDDSATRARFARGGGSSSAAAAAAGFEG